MYIRDVVVALSNPMATTEEFVRAETMQKVFPRQAPAPGQDQMLQSIMAAQSPETQGQMAEEAIGMARQQDAMEAAQSNTARGQEALISPVFGGIG